MRKSKRTDAMVESDVCECGHGRDAHEHYRKGTECSLCDIRACAEFRAVVVPVLASN